MSRRSLVTGAGGFVGAVLARRLLERGDVVTLLVGPGTDPWRLTQIADAAEIVTVDLRDRDAVAAAFAQVGPELVFHLAAHGAYSWQTDFARIVETNVTGLANVLDAAHACGVRAVVNAGSSSEYGLMDHPPREGELPQPNSAYAVAKCAATLLCGSLARARQQAITTLRLYSAYGPWEEPRRLMPTLVAHALERRLPPLVDPSIARDFVYVDDVADAFLLAADAARPGVGDLFNLGSGVQTTLRELVDVARAQFDIDEQPAWGAYPARGWDTDVWVADAAHIRQALGWRARHSLAEGLRDMALWLTESGVVERYGRIAPGATA